MSANSKKYIALFKRQLKVGEEMQQLAMQNYEAATRMVSEAKTALAEFGGPAGQALRGSQKKQNETLLKLKAGLTKVQPKTVKK